VNNSVSFAKGYEKCELFHLGKQEIASAASSNVQLTCGGHACLICGKCCDWGLNQSVFMKHVDATCRGIPRGPLYLHICWCHPNTSK
jgi:hypothetical protein